jgi:hypothetical protein
MLDRNRASTLPQDRALELARYLGWFSLALGAPEVLAPRTLTRWLGMAGSEPVVSAYGVREIGSGVGALTSKNPAGWIWGRVAGDALDIATLAAGLRSDNPKRGNGSGARGCARRHRRRHRLCPGLEWRRARRAAAATSGARL